MILVEQNSNHIDASNDLSKIVEQNSNLSLFYPSKSYNIRFTKKNHPIFVGSFEGFIKTGDTIKFNFNNTLIDGIVIGIEKDQKFVNSFEGKGQIGIIM